MRIALLQMTSGIDPAANAAVICDGVRQAKDGGAAMLFTPEMSGLLDRDRSRAAGKIVPPDQDPVLAAVCAAAAAECIWVSLGSLAVERPDGRWANRSYVIDPKGRITATYDKMHMFDVTLASGETWRESAAYVAGEGPVVTPVPGLGLLGLTICYDIRFPALFHELGRMSCDLIATPAAFTKPTGAAHWHLFQRTRATEASAYIVAAAQVGKHQDGRETYGHSLVVDPWGEVLLDMGGEAPGLGFAEIDPQRIADVRRQLPSLANRREIPRSSAQ
jgi:deaminated glutathione amidase